MATVGDTSLASLFLVSVRVWVVDPRIGEVVLEREAWREGGDIRGISIREGMNSVAKRYKNNNEVAS